MVLENLEYSEALSRNFDYVCQTIQYSTKIAKGNRNVDTLLYGMKSKEPGISHIQESKINRFVLQKRSAP
jgi:hypothetical protein